MFQYHLHTNLHLSSEKQNICLRIKGYWKRGPSKTSIDHVSIDRQFEDDMHRISVLLFFSSVNQLFKN